MVPEFARGIRRPHGRKATSSAADAAENAITPAPPRTPLQIAAGLASLNLDRIVDVVLHELAPALGARRASVYAMQRDRQILSLLRHTHGYPIDPVVAIARADQPMAVIAADASAWRRPPAWQSSRELAAAQRRHAERYGGDEFAIVPIAEPSGDQLLGLLNLSERAEGTQAADGVPLAEWADMIAQAWHNANTHDRAIRSAGTDELTGLGNYRFFRERLAQEIERSSRHGVPLSMILLDVDGLKQTNDTSGHGAGDLLLRTIAGRIREETRSIDHAARIGGDEFAIVLPSTPLSAAQSVAGQFCAAFGVGRCDGKAARSSRPSAPASASLPEFHAFRFVQAVDRSLYSAKSSGRNRVVCDTRQR